MKRRRFFVLGLTMVAFVAGLRAEDAAAPLVSFGLITDVQYADTEPQGERHYRESIPKLKTAVEDLAKQKLSFTLHLGDLIDHDFVSFAAVLPVFGGLGHPAHFLLGNHEYGVKDAQKPQVPATLGMECDYYAFSHSGVRFVMLDTNDVSSYKYPKGSAEDLAAAAVMAKQSAPGSNKPQPWNGGVSAAQLTWLEKELAAADAAKEPVIVCGHHPLRSEDGNQVTNSGEVLEVIGRHPCVRACFSGHNHGGGDTTTQEGVPCITFKSLLNVPEVTAYAVVRLFPDRLVIEGRGREKSRVIMNDRPPAQAR